MSVMWVAQAGFRAKPGAGLFLLLENQAVAFDLGFDSEAGFRRAFRRWTGRTPKGFRRPAEATRGTDRRAMEAARAAAG